MEEIEVPTEHLHEEIQEKAGEEKEKWVLYIALSTALMAVLAAVAALMAGHHANEALIARVKSSDQWNFYQSKNLKEEIAANTDQILQAIAGKQVLEDHRKDIARYEKEKAEIKKTAEEAEKDSEAHLNKHVPLATAVTAFQIAIAISAIAILTKRRKLWYGGILLTLVGIVFLILGFLP
jgi:uncharacterized membrane protein